MSTNMNGAGRRFVRRPSWLAPSVGVVLAALMILVGSACGGGGGGGNSSTSATATATATTATTTATTATNTTTTGTISDVHITAVSPANANQEIDPADISAGQTAQLQVSALNSSDQWTTEPASNWATNAPSNVATVSSSGLLTAVGSSNGTLYTITCKGPLGNLSTLLDVVPAGEPTISGLVRDKNGGGIQQVKVLFYNSSGAKTGEAITGPGGTFKTPVATSTKSFTIDISVADPLVNGTSVFYRQFEFAPSSSTGTLIYLEGNSSCLAPVPSASLSSGTLPGPIVLDDRASGPPPPPTGCSGG